MNFIQAQQLIFTRVESDYSPKRKVGYQTVYRSAALSNTLVATIEERIQCFVSLQPVVRWQYFVPERNTVVLTHTALIEPHSEIVDSTFRGAFLAHCLVLSRDQFATIHNNPFIIFDSYTDFVSDAQEMIQRFGQATGTADPIAISVESSKVAEVQEWSTNDLLKLVTVGMQASAMKQKKQELLLFGEASAIYDTLRAIFLFLPNEERLHCGFDTFTERCAYPRGFYWAVGTSTSPKSNGSVRVDVTQKKVVSEVSASSLPKEGFYFHWLTDKLSTGQVDDALRKTQVIQNLAKAFETRQSVYLKQSQEDVAREFLNFHQQKVNALLFSALKTSLEDSSAAALFPYLQQKLDRIGIFELLSTASTQQWDPITLSVYLLEWILETGPKLGSRDLDRIKEIARKSNGARLLLLASVYGKKVDNAACVEALQAMDSKIYKMAIDDCLFTHTEPAALITTPHVSLLLTDSRLDQMNEQQFVDLVREVIKVGVGNKLEPLAPGVKKLESKALLQIEKLLKKGDTINEQFQKAVAARRKELGNPGLLDHLPFGR